MAALLLRFGPPLALMALIFALSAQPDLGTGLEGWDTLLRKLGHMVEFGVLWLLWWRAFDYARPALTAAITLLYAASDELHQSFVSGRVGTPVDWLIDAAGVGLAALVVVALARARARRGLQPAALGRR